MWIYMIWSKSRGQQRKLKKLLTWIDKIEPYKNTNNLSFKDTEDTYVHFHVNYKHMTTNYDLVGGFQQCREMTFSRIESTCLFEFSLEVF